MDFRIQETMHELIAELGIEEGDYDLVSIPGGASHNLTKNIAALSLQLHHVDHFILTIHEDCGAGATHADLTASAKELISQYPDAVVDAFYVHLDGEWDEIDVE